MTSEMQPEVIYLACPYAHPDEAVREERYTAACRVAAKLIKQGKIVFSPLSHSVALAKIGDINDTDSEFWLRQDLAFLPMCSELLVLAMPGWETSVGVIREIEEARKQGIRVKFKYIDNELE